MKRLLAILVLAAQAAGAGGALYGAESLENKSVPELVAALETDSSVASQTRQTQAEEGLHALGPDSIPAILKYQESNRAQRLRVIRRACAIFGPEGDVKLLDALRDSDPTVRETALAVLPNSVVPAGLSDVVRLLEDPIRSVRIAAIQALVRLAPEREETITALVEALHDLRPAGTSPTEFSRADAAVALGKLGPKAKGAVPELMSTLADSDEDVREAAAVALWRIDKSTQGIAVLVERLDDARDYQTCMRLFKVLAEMGPGAQSAVPTIRRRIDDPGVSFVPANVNFEQAARDALTRIEPSAAK